MLKKKKIIKKKRKRNEGKSISQHTENICVEMNFKDVI